MRCQNTIYRSNKKHCRVESDLHQEMVGGLSARWPISWSFEALLQFLSCICVAVTVSGLTLVI